MKDQCPLIVFFLMSHYCPSPAGVIPSLPTAPTGLYELRFNYPIHSYVPGDFNGDGVLDFVMRSELAGDPATQHIEARLNEGTFLWEINMNSTFHPRLLSLLSWDFNEDGRWEVYFEYYSEQHRQWRNKIVDGLSGQTLADEAFPWDFSKAKSQEEFGTMDGIVYRDKIPRIVSCMDFNSLDDNAGRVWMFETYNKKTKQFSLKLMWVYERRMSSAHDMIRAADIDMNGSDDEILAGRVVLNADGSVRYDLDCTDSDQTHLGFYVPDYPGLVYAIGDDACKVITVVKAVNGEVLWELDMRSVFPWWTHWHWGWISDRDPGIPGAELFAGDRNSPAWAYLSASDGKILRKGEAWPTSDTCRTCLWDDDEFYDCLPRGFYNNIIVADIGGTGSEEIWGLADSHTIRITFNLNSKTAPSRWANRHYRQDVAQYCTGYASGYINPLVIPEKALEQDREPLRVVHVHAAAETVLIAEFNEILNRKKACEPSYYSVNQKIGKPKRVEQVDEKTIRLTFKNQWAVAQSYQLQIQGLSDPAGNILKQPITHPFQFLPDYIFTVDGQNRKADGRLDDWDDLPYVCAQPTLQEGMASDYRGAGDAKFRFGLSYDKKYLWVAVEVIDDEVILDSALYQWQQDGIEIRIDARPEEIRYKSRGLREWKDIILIVLSPGRAGPFLAEYIPFPLLSGSSRTTKGYQCEAGIPLEWLDQFQGKPWDGFRLNVAVNDYDRGEERTILFWQPAWTSEQRKKGSGLFYRKRSS